MAEAATDKPFLGLSHTAMTVDSTDKERDVLP